MTNKLFRSVSASAAVIAVGAALMLPGCSSKSTTNTSDPQATSTINLAASPTSINNGETSVVEATVVLGTAPMPNTAVVFSASPSTVGYFSPVSDTTDASGVAATIFTATGSGAVTITASIAGGTVTKTLGLSVAQAGGGSGTGNINVSTSPSLLLANGADTSRITIAVRDAIGQTAPDSTVIKVTAGEKFVDIDGNGYWSNGIDSLVFDANANGQWDALGLVPSIVYTTGGAGAANVNYISGNDAFTVYIKVTVADNGITGSAEVQLQLSPNATMNSIFLSSDSTNLVVKQTGGIETGMVRATGYDFNGNRVPEGLTINFVILDGPGGGERLGNTGYGPYTAVTNSQGVATVGLHSGTASGTVRIRAYSDTVLSNATQVLISAGPPQYAVIGAEDINVPYWYVVNRENKVVAVISDVYLNPVADNTVAYFSTDEGSMKSHEDRTHDLEGRVGSVWFSGNNVPSANGIVLIRVETSGGAVADTSYFYNSGYTTVMTVFGNPASIQADGVAKAYVTVIGVDVNGNPVHGGTPFEGEANYLSVSGGVFEDGVSSSSDRVTLVSTTLDVDYSLTGGNDNGIGATDVVSFWAGSGASTSFNISLLTGNAYGGKSSAGGPSTAAVGETIDINAAIADRWDNPLGDHTLIMTASSGTVTGATQETNGYGEATGFRWTPSDTGSFNIVITDIDPRGGIILTKKIAVE
ncbi:MAG: hypothetical protein SGI97_02930 [candidate division Zixibacteria bacterium]|nr:hypothetical protein [candidate division Zixibacteria bacterium]